MAGIALMSLSACDKPKGLDNVIEEVYNKGRSSVTNRDSKFRITLEKKYSLIVDHVSIPYKIFCEGDNESEYKVVVNLFDAYPIAEKVNDLGTRGRFGVDKIRVSISNEKNSIEITDWGLNGIPSGDSDWGDCRVNIKRIYDETIKSLDKHFQKRTN